MTKTIISNFLLLFSLYAVYVAYAASQKTQSLSNWKLKIVEWQMASKLLIGSRYNSTQLNSTESGTKL